MNIIPATKRTAMKLSHYFVMPQNGVVEGSVLYGGSGAEDQRVALGSPVASHSEAKDPPKRPFNLQVSKANGFSVKNHHLLENMEDVDEGGSLPCTPELPSDSELDVSSFPKAGDEALVNDTRQLIGQFLRNFSARTSPPWSASKALTTMDRVVNGLLEKHRYAYNGMLNRLSLESRGSDVSFVSSVAQSLFDDGTTNWGRITSLVAFGAVVCQRLTERGQENAPELVAQEICSYLLSHKKDWLLKNNSWDGFVEFFNVEGDETRVRNTLLGLCGVAGLGATLALLIRNWSPFVKALAPLFALSRRC